MGAGYRGERRGGERDREMYKGERRAGKASECGLLFRLLDPPAELCTLDGDCGW